MKCCCGQYTFGIILGVSGVVGSVIFLISELITHSSDENKPKRESAAGLMAITASISALFILAIVKKWQNLIIPWFILWILIFLGSCFFTFVSFWREAWYGDPYVLIPIILLIGACVAVAEIAIFCFSCHLYLEIRRENYGNFSESPAVERV